MNNVSPPKLPWYKQFWPWFLILLPLSVVIASVITFVIAQNNKPSLVSGNYYKEGLAINANKKLEENARLLGLTADLIANGTTLTVHLNGLEVEPLSLIVDLRHSTISQHDKSLTLTRISDGVYQSPFILPKAGKWYIDIKGVDHEWEIKKLAYFDYSK